MKRLLSFLLVCCAALAARAQTFTLQGRVTDRQGNPVELVTVACVAQGKATMTSLKGNYTLTLRSADSVVVRFSMIGYRTRTRVLRRPRGRQTLQVVMAADDVALQEVDVRGERIQTGQTQELRTKDMQQAPSASGNAVEQLVQSQAGVSTHSELSAQYNVRGGSFDENSVYINNVEVYRPFLVRSGQQEGLSVINPDMVERIGFSTGGFAPKYGDKMSSALDITYRRPSRPFEATATASMLGGSAYIGIATKRLAWANGVRYKNCRYLLSSLQENGEYRPNFLDYQTYLSYRPNERWQVELIGNIADNHYNFCPRDRNTAFGTMQNVMNFQVYFDGQERDRFRTYFGSLSLKRTLAPATSLSLIASAYSTREQETYDIQGQYWLTQTETSEDLGVGTYFQHARNYLRAHVESAKLMLQSRTRHHDLEAAVTLKREHIRENSAEYEMRDSAGYSVPHTGRDLQMVYSLRCRDRIDATRTEAYLQDTWRFSSGRDSLRTLYTLTYGLRLSHWNFNRETILSPRASIGVIPACNQNVTLRLAAGLYYQAPFYKELRDTTAAPSGVTTVTLNRKIKSQRSIHLLAAYDYRFRVMRRPFRFTAEAYYKILQDLIPYSVNNVKTVYYGDNLCSGHAAGVDLKLYGEFVPGTDSWLTLSLMDTRMRMGDVSMPLPTDQRWSVNLFFTDYFPGTTRWKMSLRLALADGLPFSAPHRETQRNSFRAPAYKRADIGLSYRLIDNAKHPGRAVRNLWIGADCLNLLGINNVNSYYWVTDVTSQQYAVPNYLTGRMLNARVRVEF